MAERKATPGTRIGRGAGWGGPAKGEGTKKRFAAGDEHRGMATAENRAANIAEREEILGFYTDVLRDPDETTLNRLTAGDKILDRTEGKPVTRQITADVDDASTLTDAELAADIARLSAAFARAVEGAREAPAGEPPGTVPALPETG